MGLKENAFNSTMNEVFNLDTSLYSAVARALLWGVWWVVGGGGVLPD